MAVRPQGRKAQTQFRVLTRLAETTLLLVKPHTGRTHQIRVHLNYIGHTIIGDPIYSREEKRLMLHAWRIEFAHPATEKRRRFEAPIPPEFPKYSYHELPWPKEQHAGNPARPNS